MAKNAVRSERIAVVVTSISGPNEVLKTLARDCLVRNIKFYLIGDVKSPADFALEGCEFFGVAEQRRLGFATASLLPTGHYARKNIGYLQAMRDGAAVIIETDDDNIPGPHFYEPLEPRQSIQTLRGTGWVNVYRYQSDLRVWPRGLPLDAISGDLPELSAPQAVYCPIQQGLADDNPDVDAIYRLLMPLPVKFTSPMRLALQENAWCPFNSQNTVFFQDAFLLLYLPSFCSFRVTDIWRSFVAQRIAWSNGWSVLFREATVRQVRNDHRLMKDFEDEIPGYLHNRDIGSALQALVLPGGPEGISDSLRLCYAKLVDCGFIGCEELPLLEAWIEDVASFSPQVQRVK